MNDMVETITPKLCIVSMYSYPLFNPECVSPFGGSEVRVSLIARELAKRENLQVSMIVFDHDQPDNEIIDGVKIIPWRGKRCSLSVNAPDTTKLPEPSLPERAYTWVNSHCSDFFVSLLRTGYRVLRAVYRFYKYSPFFVLGLITGKHPVRKSEVNIYDQIDADVFIGHGNSILTAELAYYCKKRGRKFVLLGGSDPDFHPDYKYKPDEMGVYGMGYLMTSTIENASALIVQNDGQAKILKNVYSRASTVIRNPVNTTRIFEVDPEKRADKILWVGKSDWIKRPEIVLNLAAELPDFDFTLIMSFSDMDIHNRCKHIASNAPNITILDYVPFGEIERYFAQSKLFVNTSVFEGFPNTFLQAAKYGVPVISYEVDPGEMMTKHGCGMLCKGDFGSLVNNTRECLTDPAVYSKLSENCNEYILAYHGKEKLIPEYEKVICSVL